MTEEIRFDPGPLDERGKPMRALMAEYDDWQHFHTCIMTCRMYGLPACLAIFPDRGRVVGNAVLQWNRDAARARRPRS